MTLQIQIRDEWGNWKSYLGITDIELYQDEARIIMYRGGDYTKVRVSDKKEIRIMIME